MLSLWVIRRSLHVDKKKTKKKTKKKNNEDHWSCIAHLSAEDKLKSAVIKKKKSLKILNLCDLDQGQWMTLTFVLIKLSFSWLHLPTFIS